MQAPSTKNFPITTWEPDCRFGKLASMSETYFKEWRLFRGLTQAQAAELSGISEPVLSRIENGRRKYDSTHLSAMARAYMCEEWELIGRNPTDGGAGAIVSIWDHIPQRNREQARQILETFTEKKA